MRAQLSDAIADYERFRKSMDIGKNTLKVQRSTLLKFLNVNGNIWCHAIADWHVTRFFEEAAKTKQPQSLRNDHTVLAGFFDWARQTKRMGSDNDPMYGRRKPKRLVKERNRVHVSKFGALLDAAEARSPRDRIALAVLLYTLGRDGEVTSLRIRDVGLDDGYLLMRQHKTKTEDRVPIYMELEDELRRWLTTYASEVGHLEPHYFLVPSRDTSGVRDAEGLIYRNEHVRYCPERQIPALGKIVSPALADIGFPIRDGAGKPMGEGAHTVRRSGARALFDRLVDSGYDGALRVTQSLLHHSSVATTEIYLGISADRRTRDEIIRGKRMFPMGVENVVDIRNGRRASGADL